VVSAEDDWLPRRFEQLVKPVHAGSGHVAAPEFMVSLEPADRDQTRCILVAKIRTGRQVCEPSHDQGTNSAVIRSGLTTPCTAMVALAADRPFRGPPGLVAS
jgi:hypothetical protein